MKAAIAVCVAMTLALNDASSVRMITGSSFLQDVESYSTNQTEKETRVTSKVKLFADLRC